jgi:hypothetical protein
MSGVGELLAGLREAALSIALSRLPHELPVDYAPGSVGAGTRAGRFLLAREGANVKYQYQAEPTLKALEEARCEHQIGHTFTELSSIAQYMLPQLDAQGWLSTKPFERATLQVVLEELAPERGFGVLDIQRHPRWLRWAEAFGTGELRDIGHHLLADTVLDNREDLEEPMIAKQLAQFRAVRKVEYDADLGDGGHEAVRATWKGTGGAPGPQGAIEIPREFTAFVPAWTGPWTPGDEPLHKAVFRLRVLPPEADGPPKFRVAWVNALDFEIEATRTLFTRVAVELAPRPLFAGHPLMKHFVVPTREG